MLKRFTNIIKDNNSAFIDFLTHCTPKVIVQLYIEISNLLEKNTSMAVKQKMLYRLRQQQLLEQLSSKDNASKEDKIIQSESLYVNKLLLKFINISNEDERTIFLNNMILLRNKYQLIPSKHKKYLILNKTISIINKYFNKEKISPPQEVEH